MNKSSNYCWLILFSISLHSATAAESKEKALAYTAVKNQKLQEEKNHQAQWSLTQVEWTRYKTLMKGIRGSISPKNISPIEVLGTHARNDAERRKYAEIWATMRHDDIEKILAFQFAYDEAFARLYPNEQMINTKLLKLSQQGIDNVKPGDRLLVFLKTEQCSACEQTIQKIMRDETFKSLHVDIYFIDTHSQSDDNKLRLWAKRHNIDQQRLKAGSITLNHDQGTLHKLTKKVINTVPVVFSFDAKKTTRIQL